ncbi:MAG: poly-gamma-glutamate system protein [Verrucomicrobiota bacterium]
MNNANSNFQCYGAFRPRQGRVRLHTSVLVALAALAVSAAAISAAWARAHEWRGLIGGANQITSADLTQKAAHAKEMAQRAEKFLQEAKLAAALPRDPGLWSADSPWLGDELTPLVTTLGSLEAKRIAANPDWARVLTFKLHELGVRPSSVVAAGCSGSFPGLNLSLACACEALAAKLITVSSVTASTWGANQPGFTWPEIESRLVRAGIIGRLSSAVAMGGFADGALDLEPTAREVVRKIQSASAAELGASVMRPASLQESVQQRLAIYAREAAGQSIVLYVNVGGTEASLGESPAAFHLRSGFIAARPFDLSPGRGVIARFAEQGVPTLSLLHVEGLALEWGVTQASREQAGNAF